MRSVIPTSDFSIPSEESIGDTHKKLAKTKRANEIGLDNLDDRMFTDAADQMKVEDLSIFGQVDLHPIIFEECYVKDND